MKSVKHRIRIHGKLHYNHFTIGNSVIRWKATSQPSVALSTTESEYMALTKVAKERIWLKGLIEDLGFPQDQELQEADGSSDGPKRRRTYIYREREEAEQRLIDDYFGDDEYEPKYPEEKFRRSDPKLVRINTIGFPAVINWEVEVFTLSAHVWKTVSNIPPTFRTCHLTFNHVFVEGFIYWRAYDNIELAPGILSNMIISFDLKSDEFGVVYLPGRLVQTNGLVLSKVYESLGLFEYYYNDGETRFCDVWIMKEGVTKSFTKMLSIKATHSWVRYRVLELRKNGEVIIENIDDTNSSILQVYEPSSGRISGVGINGSFGSLKVNSYMKRYSYLMSQILSFIEDDDKVHQYGDVSPKVDVYAFGVVLYELISAKEAIVKANGSVTESKGLVALFDEVLSQPDPKDDLIKIIDPRMGDNYPLDSVRKMAQLAKACTHENPQLRPSMRSIVVALMTLSSSTEDWDVGSFYDNQTLVSLMSGR
ncbi:chitin elicitor receptor kinase [Tanacetum coccineum]|uniref:Chitin elicitor receptor kinase n=1 Tax=Tanacetum coccineum TaxID=301880 RepID=A0ABQ4WL41_9ASTR